MFVSGQLGIISGVRFIEVSPPLLRIGDWCMAYSTDMVATEVAEERISVTDSLKRDLKKALQHVAELESTIKVIEDNPGAQAVIDSLAKIGRLNRY